MVVFCHRRLACQRVPSSNWPPLVFDAIATSVRIVIPSLDKMMDLSAGAVCACRGYSLVVMSLRKHAQAEHGVDQLYNVADRFTSGFKLVVAKEVGSCPPSELNDVLIVVFHRQ